MWKSYDAAEELTDSELAACIKQADECLEYLNSRTRHSFYMLRREVRRERNALELIKMCREEYRAKVG